MEKNDLRKLIRQRKAAMDTALLEQMSCSVCESIMESREWQSAKVVLLYMSLRDEVSTTMLIKEAEKARKTVLLPTCVGDDLILRIYEGEERMHTGAFGIMESMGRVYDEGEYQNIDLAIIPGMAFDMKGGRVGRGRGFYDRLLPKLNKSPKVGVCWEFQIVDSVPMDEYDIQMDFVIYK